MSCPFLPLTERDLAGNELSDAEARRLEDHLGLGCEECEARLGGGWEADPPAAFAELDASLGAAFGRAGDELEASRLQVLARVRERVLDEALSQRRRVRRRGLRVAFYLVNLVAVFSLVSAYLGNRMAIRVLRTNAQSMATQTEVVALNRALARYAIERRQLPESVPELLKALSGPRRGDGLPYYPFDPARLRAGEYLDDFGRPYRLRVYRNRALVYSLGRNARDDAGEGDDLRDARGWVTVVK